MAVATRGGKPIGTVTDETHERLCSLTGHVFKDRARLDRALTHSSARARTGKDYERLEFLGDRVLGLCVAELLFESYRDANEGELSVRLNALVNADMLAEISDEMQLSDFIRAGDDVADITSSRQKNLRADVVESLIAVIYIEGGLEAARAFIHRYWPQRAATAASARRDPKTELQEWAHRIHKTTPGYVVVSREGPDHEPVFGVRVSVGPVITAMGSGPSKRIAEQNAARELLEAQGIWQTGDQA